jgi:uncharacterized protein
VPSIIADAGFLAGLLDRRDNHHCWAVAQAARLGPPWHTCEAVLTEAFYLLQPSTAPLISLLQRRETVVAFDFDRDAEPVLALMQKYADVPMSLADACLVRMTETHSDPIVLTTDTHFRIYRRHSRQVVPCVLPD